MKPTYRRRTCRKEYSRHKIHDAVDKHLNNLEFLPDNATFKRALIKVWRNQRGSVIQRIGVLQANQARIEADTIKTVSDLCQGVRLSSQKCFASFTRGLKLTARKQKKRNLKNSEC